MLASLFTPAERKVLSTLRDGLIQVVPGKDTLADGRDGRDEREEIDEDEECQTNRT